MSKVSKKVVLKLLKKGNKSCSERLYLDLLRKLKFEQNIKNPVKFVETVISNISTPVTLISKKVGGTVYQIPVSVKENKDVSVAISWVLEYVRNNKGSGVVNKICDELLLAKKNEGETIKRKLSLHKLALSNRAFLKFLG